MEDKKEIVAKTEFKTLLDNAMTLVQDFSNIDVDTLSDEKVDEMCSLLETNAEHGKLLANMLDTETYLSHNAIAMEKIEQQKQSAKENIKNLLNARDYQIELINRIEELKEAYSYENNIDDAWFENLDHERKISNDPATIDEIKNLQNELISHINDNGDIEDIEKNAQDNIDFINQIADKQIVNKLSDHQAKIAKQLQYYIEELKHSKELMSDMKISKAN